MRNNINPLASAFLGLFLTTSPVMVVSTLTGCSEQRDAATDVPIVSGADNGVNVSSFTEENCFQDMEPLGYASTIGMPTTMFHYAEADACYAGLNSKGESDDLNRPGNLCAEVEGVKIAETGVTYVLTELDPGVDLSDSWYQGNWYNQADKTCDPSDKGSSCWATTQNCQPSKWISTYLDTEGVLQANFSALSTQDGLIGKGDLAN